jgi:hypothetical protein
MSVRAPLTFDQSQEQVEAMMEQGTAFGRVEDAIDAAELYPPRIGPRCGSSPGRCATTCSSVRMRGSWWLPWRRRARSVSVRSRVRFQHEHFEREVGVDVVIALAPPSERPSPPRPVAWIVRRRHRSPTPARRQNEENEDDGLDRPRASYQGATIDEPTGPLQPGCAPIITRPQPRHPLGRAAAAGDNTRYRSSANRDAGASGP